MIIIQSQHAHTTLPQEPRQTLDSWVNAYDVLVDIPPSVDLATLPAKGAVPIELCEAAGCRSKMPAEDVPVIDACSVYPYRPDETEQLLVCSFHDERPATTM